MKLCIPATPIVHVLAIASLPLWLSACGGGSAGDSATLLNNAAVVPASPSSASTSGSATAQAEPSSTATATEEFSALLTKVIGPSDRAYDAACNLYILSRQDAVIRKIVPDGTTTILAGSVGERGANDGSGGEARFNFPSAMTIDGAGNLYVLDSFTVRRVTPGGVVTTIAGTANAKGDVDATGSAARFDNPSDITADASGNLYVSELDLHVIRKVTPNGIVTTFAGIRGSGTVVDGAISVAQFIGPLGLSFDTNGNLYVHDVTFPPSNFSPSNQSLIRKISADGVVSTIASDRDPAKTLRKLRKHWKAVPLDQAFCVCRQPEDGGPASYSKEE